MNFNCTEQVGGFHEIHVYALEETANWPEVVTDLNSKDIVFTPIAASVQGEIDPDSMQVDEPKSLTEAGRLFRISIGFDYVSQSPGLEQLLEQYECVPVVVTVCKNYNQKKLYGTNKYPLYLSYKPQHGKRLEDGSITQISIAGSIPVRPVYILNPVVIQEPD